jgi:hypothetical protein
LDVTFRGIGCQSFSFTHCFFRVCYVISLKLEKKTCLPD